VNADVYIALSTTILRLEIYPIKGELIAPSTHDVATLVPDNKNTLNPLSNVVEYVVDPLATPSIKICISPTEFRVTATCDQTPAETLPVLVNIVVPVPDTPDFDASSDIFPPIINKFQPRLAPVPVDCQFETIVCCPVTQVGFTHASIVN
jgi:hypothetical protein